MIFDRRRALAVAAAGLLGSGCHTTPAGTRDAQPAVPWPGADTLGIGLEGYSYPYPVHYLDVTHVAQATWIDRQAPEWERRARLAYMDIAPESGQPRGEVLLVHGKNFFGAYWKDVIQALRQQGYRTIVPDLVGWGKSTKPSTLTAESLVAHLDSLLGALNVNSVAVIGHSTGGLVAMHMARALPARVASLVLENPMGLEDYRRGLIRQVGHEDWAADERSSTADQIRQYLAHYFVNKDPRLIEPFVAVRTAIGASPEFERWVQSSAAATDMLLNEPAVDFVASLSARTLFVCGLSDRTYVGAKYTAPNEQAAKGNIAAMAQGFATRMPAARFVGVPDTGHVPHLETPAAFLSAVREFLR
ncbi:alpha/beta fold hydrolase [Mycobacterium sp. Aquia_213]|uniref:alpha/beta fold hydrolase n=1 Tax=Mycobacterium sp. Aquia_213 TaxID=2991728 RepID=UPI00226E3F95|nr:alpha/beta hydrolase [Mycobacterium sp. Aquia_213]WAC91287.1 alpha/beta hydrolase [Mycobacterium sp. Aquia_213]